MQVLRSTWTTPVFVVGLLAICQRHELFASGANSSGSSGQHQSSRLLPALSRPLGRWGSDPQANYDQEVVQSVSADGSGSVNTGKKEDPEPVYSNVLRFRKATELPTDSETSSSTEDDSEEEERQQPATTKHKNDPRPLPRPRSSVGLEREGVTTGIGRPFDRRGHVGRLGGPSDTYTHHRRSHDAGGYIGHTGIPPGEEKRHETPYDNGSSVGMREPGSERHADAGDGSVCSGISVPSVYVTYVGGHQRYGSRVRDNYGNTRRGARMRRRVAFTYQESSSSAELDSEEEEREHHASSKHKNVKRPLRGQAEHSPGPPDTRTHRGRSHHAGVSSNGNIGFSRGTGGEQGYGTPNENWNSVGMRGLGAECHADTPGRLGDGIIPASSAHLSYVGGRRRDDSRIRGGSDDAGGGARTRRRVTSTPQGAGNSVPRPDVLYTTELGSRGGNSGKSKGHTQSQQRTKDPGDDQQLLYAEPHTQSQQRTKDPGDDQQLLYAESHTQSQRRTKGPGDDEQLVYAELQFPDGRVVCGSELLHLYETVDFSHPERPPHVPSGEAEPLFGATGPASRHRRPLLFPHEDHRNVYTYHRPMTEEEVGNHDYEELPMLHRGSVESGSTSNVSESNGSEQSEGQSVRQRIRKAFQKLRLKL